MPTRSAAPLVAIALCAQSAAAGRVWVVEPSGGSIQTAIDAASDGDLLLVESGHYAGFRITNRSLCVAAEDRAHVVIAGPVLVRDLDATRDVVLAGLSLDRQLWCTDSPGSIRVEDRRILLDPTSFSSGRHAALVERCGDVVIVDCTLQGAGQLGFLAAGSGVSMSASNVALFGVTATGGAGWPERWASTAWREPTARAHPPARCSSRPAPSSSAARAEQDRRGDATDRRAMAATAVVV